MIKILMGGSPCTFWSITQKNNREVQAEGLGWELFKNYLIAKEKFKPNYFLYENNKSAAQPIKDQISKELGVDLMYINSALVSAQNRQRFYAFNWEVEQPEDRGILLQDILESGIDLSQNEKSYCLTASYNGACAWNTIERNQRTMVARPIRIGSYPTKDGELKNAQGQRIHSVDGKSVNLTANGGGLGAKTGLYAEQIHINKTIRVSLSEMNDKFGYIPEMFNAYNRAEIIDKAPTLSTGSMVASSCAVCKFQPLINNESEDISNSIPYNVLFQDVDNSYYIFDNNGNKVDVYEVIDGIITIKNRKYPIKLNDGYYIIRKLTVKECCRLQTLPDNYCDVVSKSQAYRGLGNGWTAEVIIHILNGILRDVPKDEEIVVLSMYDGIGTGRYCLDKMGFTNIKYYAYEIDKYAKQIAMSNYPDIIQMGDAFDIREEGWRLVD